MTSRGQTQIGHLDITSSDFRRAIECCLRLISGQRTAVDFGTRNHDLLTRSSALCICVARQRTVVVPGEAHRMSRVELYTVAILETTVYLPDGGSYSPAILSYP